MPARLRHIDATRPPGRARRAYAALSNTSLGRFLSEKVVWKLDPVLMKLTGGRLGLGLMMPTALLETTGAKSGRRRATVVIYFHDGELVTIVPSYIGRPVNPAWFHNLLADPAVTFAGAPMRASVVAGEAERERLWGLADNVFPPYADYRREAAAAGREIPIVQLRSRAG